MSNNVHPSFLPPPYDFTTEKDEESYEEDEEGEEYGREIWRGILTTIGCGTTFGLTFVDTVVGIGIFLSLVKRIELVSVNK